MQCIDCCLSTATRSGGTKSFLLREAFPLLTKAESLNKCSVVGGSRSRNVLQQPVSLSNKFHKTKPRGMIFLVGLQMLIDLLNSGGQ